MSTETFPEYSLVLRQKLKSTGCFFPLIAFTTLQQMVRKKSGRKCNSRQDANMWNYNYWSLVVENAFPLCLNALLRRYCLPQQVDSGPAARLSQNWGGIVCRIVIRATGSCLYEISISSVTDCYAVMSSTMTWTTNNNCIQTLLLFHAHHG